MGKKVRCSGTGSVEFPLGKWNVGKAHPPASGPTDSNIGSCRSVPGWLSPRPDRASLAGLFVASPLLLCRLRTDFWRCCCATIIVYASAVCGYPWMFLCCSRLDVYMSSCMLLRCFRLDAGILGFSAASRLDVYFSSCILLRCFRLDAGIPWFLCCFRLDVYMSSCMLLRCFRLDAGIPWFLCCFCCCSATGF